MSLTLYDLIQASHQAAQKGEVSEMRSLEEAALKKATDLSPQCLELAEVHAGMALNRYYLKTYSEAEPHLKKYAEIRSKLTAADPTDTYGLYTSLAYTAQSQGEWRRAADDYQRAQEIAMGFYDPKSPRVEKRLMPWWAQSNRALALSEGGEHQEAMRLGRDALKRVEDLKESNRNLLSFYEKLVRINRRKNESKVPVPPLSPTPPLGESKAPSEEAHQPQENLEEVLAELDELVGLSRVKAQVRSLVNFLKIQKLREDQGYRAVQISHHVVFTGSPGTGKTTVARLMGRIYHALGILATDKLIEVSREDLIAGFVGQTAVKVNEVVDSALDGTLFIDEAYALTASQGNDFGQEAVATLLKRMEDDRDRLVVIVAGYSEPMESFITSNPGLKSRFTTTIEFEDYSVEELVAIFRFMAKRNDYHMSDKAEQKLERLMKKVWTEKGEDFGNARTVRNIFEDTISTQANRLVETGISEGEKLSLIEPQDLTVED